MCVASMTSRSLSDARALTFAPGALVLSDMLTSSAKSGGTSPSAVRARTTRVATALASSSSLSSSSSFEKNASGESREGDRGDGFLRLSGILNGRTMTHAYVACEQMKSTNVARVTIKSNRAS